MKKNKGLLLKDVPVSEVVSMGESLLIDSAMTRPEDQTLWGKHQEKTDNRVLKLEDHLGIERVSNAS